MGLDADCGPNSAMTNFKLVIESNSYFKYSCVTLPYYPTFNMHMTPQERFDCDHNCFHFLDRHNINCPNNVNLNRFVIIYLGGIYMQYQYWCTSQPPSNIRVTCYDYSTPLVNGVSNISSTAFNYAGLFGGDTNNFPVTRNYVIARFQFVTVHENPLKIFFSLRMCYICDISCAHCNIWNVSWCTICGSGYYPKEESPLPNRCYIPSPYNYYLIGSVFKKCFSLCASCSGLGNTSNHLCNSCITGYYLLFNTQTCLPENQPPLGYYPNSTLLKHMPCHNNCESCTNAYTALNNMCDTCKINYYAIKNINPPFNCYNAIPSPGNYFLDITIAPNTWTLCNANCSSCTQAGDAFNNNCILCSLGFYSKESKNAPFNCYNLPP